MADLQPAQRKCAGCGGSGFRVDEMERGGIALHPDEREMLDDARCHHCYGSGLADESQLHRTEGN
jgi:hypothetical protein